MHMAYRPVLFIVLACLLWSFDIIIRSLSASHVSSELAVFIEYLIGVLFLVPLLIYKERKEIFTIKKKHFLGFIFLGVFGSLIASILFTKGVLILGSGSYSFFQVFQPILVAWLASIFLKEKFDELNGPWAFWCILSAVMINYSNFQNASFALDGFLWAMSAMILWGISTVVGKYLLFYYSPLMVTTWRTLIALLASLPMMIYYLTTHNVGLEVLDGNLISFGLFGVISGAVAMWIYYKGLKFLKASTVGFLELSYSAFGMLLTSLYLYKTIELITLLGVVSLAGALFIIFKKDLSNTKN